MASEFERTNWQTRDQSVDELCDITGLFAFRWVNGEIVQDLIDADVELREAILDEMRDEYPSAVLVETNLV